MTTKQRRGRDPEQHEIIVGLPNAARHIGLVGELTAVADPETGDIVSIRFHNGTLPGGYPVPVHPFACRSSGYSPDRARPR